MVGLLKTIVLTCYFLYLCKECVQMRPDQEIYRELDNAEIVGDMIFEKSNTRMAKRSRQNWPGGIIPYIISQNVSNDLRSIIFNATNYICEHTCIQFRPALQTDNYWIRFLMYENPDANQICSSYIGWLNWKDQGVFLGKRCFFGAMVHELLHTIGFYHEHTRNDRDKFIRINTTNYANTNVANNYKLDNEGCRPNENCTFDDYHVNYNYESIMHYCQYCGSKDPRYPVFTAIHNPNAIGDPKKIGQREGFSKGDWLMTNRKYGCHTAEQSQPADLPSEPTYQDPQEIEGESSRLSSTTIASTSTPSTKITKATTPGPKPPFCSAIPFRPCKNNSTYF